MRIDLREDPAVVWMAGELGVREEVVVGYLHSIWSWMSRQCSADSVTLVTLMSLGRVTNLVGFPELMSRAGWLSEGVLEDGTPFVTIPNFDRWLSNTAKKRILSAKRQQKRRNAGEPKTSRKKRDKSVTKGKERIYYKPYTSLSDAFGAWYAIYPKKVGRQDAEKKFAKSVAGLAGSHSEPVTYLLERVRAFSASDKGRGEYCPNPSTWLSQGRYDDDDAAWKDTPSTPQPQYPERKDIWAS